MQLIRDRAALAPHRNSIFIPTMGALHAGHRALITHARSIASKRPVLVSIFINPTQFNDQQDFTRYPRTLDADRAVCESAGADIVFAPPVEVMYPPGETIESPPLPAVATDPVLEDAHRPGHFQGVCQVVARLFDLVKPAAAIFGEKDWQQLAVIRAMVSAKAAPIDIIPHPTIREPDGLAMSSRNILLAPNHRRQATALVKSLLEAGRHPAPDAAERAARRVLLANRITPDYFAIRDAETLLAPRANHPARALVAVRIGNIRLIDNAPWPGFALSIS